MKTLELSRLSVVKLTKQFPSPKIRKRLPEYLVLARIANFTCLLSGLVDRETSNAIYLYIARTSSYTPHEITYLVTKYIKIYGKI